MKKIIVLSILLLSTPLCAKSITKTFEVKESFDKVWSVIHDAYADNSQGNMRLDYYEYSCKKLDAEMKLVNGQYEPLIKLKGFKTFVSEYTYRFPKTSITVSCKGSILGGCSESYVLSEVRTIKKKLKKTNIDVVSRCYNYPYD